MNTAPLTDTDTTLAFMLAGNARVTLKSTKTGTRYTYRLRLAEDAAMWFVSLLTGSDNESDYTYAGIIAPQAATAAAPAALVFKTTKASKYRADSSPVLALRYTLAHLTSGHMPKGVEISHEGRCGRCGRALTVPESVASGIGPECAQKMAA